MKTKYSIILLFVITTLSAFSQSKFKLDLINNSYEIGDTVVVKLDNTDGAIQWQTSIDLSTWYDIVGQNDDSLMYIVDTSIYIRGSIVYGTCNPYFSDTLHIIGLTPFICGNQISDYDGNQYNTVQIGNQCWMSESLMTSHYSNGISIPYITSNSVWAALVENNTDDAFCFYNNSLPVANTYGALYTWAAAMGDNAVSSSSNPSGVQGVCPDDWHLPSNEEWNELRNYFSPFSSAGGKLKESGVAHWNSPNTGATNSSGFNGLPGGYRDDLNGTFFYMGNFCFLWSSTEHNGTQAWYSKLSFNNSALGGGPGIKSQGFSVRCLKD